MTASLLARLKEELAAFGAAHDAQAPSHGQRLLNITPDTGEFLAVLVRATQARRIVEIGTSNGYSTLWLAEAAQPQGGHVTTLERDPAKLAMARENFARGGLSAAITAWQGDAGDWLAAAPAASIDLVFLDAQRAAYVDWWPGLDRLLRPGGLLVVDNAVSHAEEVAGLRARIDATPGYTVSLVPVGKGELLAVKPGGAVLKGS
ncbi:O-methyltransferase [Stenotrophomonas sp. HITSZ_GD]|uniref:O-methyltransferase n=1 Tax=Stenotrophomonas sp. HITSZ_GD TaxID=3037248 RepID=UPI00240E8482|nr:O-methyltransferase [Stenotrophomonas sp. HITSZ_GD]MDG2523903.1 O-methyltransferase [Stenotrophomonas sp. HITSZ_GD]